MTPNHTSSHIIGGHSHHGNIPVDATGLAVDFVDDDEDSSIAGLSDMTSVLSGGEDHEGLRQIEKLAQKENRGIRFWRALVVCFLIVIGATVSTGTYLFLNKEVEDESKKSFALFANSIADASRFHVKGMFTAVQSMAREFTAHTLATNQTFPFVTFPMFEVYAREARNSASMEIIGIVPKVDKKFVDNGQWAAFSVASSDWISEGRNVAAALDNFPNASTYEMGDKILPFIFKIDYKLRRPVKDDGDGPFTPLWMISPSTVANNGVNFNYFSLPYFSGPMTAADSLKDLVFGEVVEGERDAARFDNFIGLEQHQAIHEQLHGTGDPENNPADRFRPHGVIVQPIFDRLDEGEEEIQTVGYVIANMPYDAYLLNLLPQGVSGVFLVIENDCEQSFTYMIDGNKANYLGKGDQHDPAFDDEKQSVSFNENYKNSEAIRRDTPNQCEYTFNMYPSVTYKDQYKSALPLVVTSIVAASFVMMTVSFFMFNFFVQRKNDKVVGAAARSNAIVSSLFPSSVRERLFNNSNRAEDDHTATSSYTPVKYNLRKFLNGANPDGTKHGNNVVLQSKPIADLFLHTTVMFADISGFTAWSSVREPAQVFTLLETVYRAFDYIAKKRAVFKVETIGDCYVAVCGLPDPRDDHASNMARFARDCMKRFHALTQRLEVTLGPDTGDLSLRVGLHSGQVTAGVLRGERSRFQLFGDTMNTAARMESTGIPGRIQISQETAKLLDEDQKSSWYAGRADSIQVKGKGALHTCWLKLKAGPGHHAVSYMGDSRTHDWASSNFDVLGEDRYDTKESRLIEWNVEVLHRLLRQIVVRRNAATKGKPEKHPSSGIHSVRNLLQEKSASGANRTTVLDEVQEIIMLPKFDPQIARRQQDPETFQLHPQVVSELSSFLSGIASMYRNNPFHNFEHASHVTISVNKLLSRIIAPSDLDIRQVTSHTGTGLSGRDGTEQNQVLATLHDHTYGITSDPLTQFACILSALIHDTDHMGVPNAQLVKENAEIASFYKGQSVAEQNSVDLAWALLMSPDYEMLRSTIYSTDQEKERFRQLVVNSVMATDIVDKELKALRNARWEKAFSETQDPHDSLDDVVNRKATIVIEHLIQASDVSHTMQHWHIYRKWNERFFMECYRAYQQGRAAVDPAKDWYKGELGFFDFYIIPLAKKLKDCGVFGVSSDEYLNYAIKNRTEWEARGQEVLSEMVERARILYPSTPSLSAGQGAKHYESGAASNV